MYSNYYLLGIGGIGMSAIARYFKSLGCNVSGYDRTESPLTKQLESEGIEIHYEDRPDLIPFNTDNTFVVYTPAIPEDLKEFQFVKEHGYGICKRSRMLGVIAEGKDCLAISGTHGKTTTSTLLTHIMQTDEIGCSAFLGGISKNYNSNLVVSMSNVLVAEADEFDRSFLQLHPLIAVITAIDADHLDIYNDYAHVKEAFEAFAAQVHPEGAVIVKKGVEIDCSGIKAKVLRYSYDSPCDFYASDIVESDGGYYSFTINYPGGTVRDCKAGVPGWVNVENSIAAAAVALQYGAAPASVREAIASFKGVARRFDIRVNEKGCTYIDDYAHHPKELESAISSIREMFKGRRICGIFQPHLYTRTRDFADGFAAALSNLDELIMLPIYPARELPIEGVNSEMILDKVTIKDKMLVQKSELMDIIKSKKIDCLVTFGAGDIDHFVVPIENYLKECLKKY
ncbi:MAG: UDP-N-acetylmuramate--L-alanine ligase [Bacteroidales bacterium]|nr:UDP-N-acetylmuramate--L-alanine ligase [Bacteroidales bacterium]